MPSGHGAPDALLDALVSATVSKLDGPEGLLGRAIMPQTWLLTLDSFPAEAIKLPLGPLIEVVSVIYDDVDGAPITIDPSAYHVDRVNFPGWIVPIEDWPETLDGINAVRITFRAGYNVLPAALKQAIIQQTMHLWMVGGERAMIRSETVEGVGSISYNSSEYASAGLCKSADMLLAPYVVFAL